MKPFPHLLRRLLTAARAAADPAAAHPFGPPPGFTAGILQRRRHDTAQAEPSFLVLLRNLSLGAAAAAVCVALGLGLLLRSPDALVGEDDVTLQSQLESWVTPL
ncbi:MAG: hypothetical protein JNK85_08680 [Verrucomicrobiales bacterium]|nr:hypothetical protein [Verrucomicrobiales bacterium]